MNVVPGENSDVDSAGVYFVSVEEFEQREPGDRGAAPLAEGGAEPPSQSRPIKALRVLR
jgi:hypothetical protein